MHGRPQRPATLCTCQGPWQNPASARFEILLLPAIRTGTMDSHRDFVSPEAGHEHIDPKEEESRHQQEMRDRNEHGAGGDQPTESESLERANPALPPIKGKDFGFPTGRPIGISHDVELLCSNFRHLRLLSLLSPLSPLSPLNISRRPGYYPLSVT